MRRVYIGVVRFFIAGSIRSMGPGSRVRLSSFLVLMEALLWLNSKLSSVLSLGQLLIYDGILDYCVRFHDAVPADVPGVSDVHDVRVGVHVRVRVDVRVNVALILIPYPYLMLDNYLFIIYLIA